MVKIKIIVHIAGEEIDWDKIPEEKRRIISEKIQETMMSEEIDWDKIPEEKRRIISEKIQETMMSSAGYKRAPA